MTIKLRCVRDYDGPQWPHARVGDVRDLEPYQVEQLFRDLPSAFERIVEKINANPADSSDQANGDGQGDPASADPQPETQGAGSAPAQAEASQDETAAVAPADETPEAETPKRRGRVKAAQED